MKKTKKNLRLGIFGSFNQGSLGDLAILQGIVNLFYEDIATLTIFSFAPKNTRQNIALGRLSKKTKILPASPFVDETKNANKEKTKKINHIIRFFKKVSFLNFLLSFLSDFRLILRTSFWKNKQEEIETLDLLLIGGGNILMDLYQNWPIYPYLYSKIAKKAHIPVVLFACGAGPIGTLKGRILIKKTINNACVVTTRDQKSKKMLKKLDVNKKIVSIIDPAFILKNHRKAHRKNLLGMTVVPYFDPRYWPRPDEKKYREYIQEMANLVDQVVKKFATRICFFTTNFPYDYYVAEDIYELSKNKTQIVIRKTTNLQEIMSVISECRIIIGSRLHSLILSFISKTPFLALSYQQKVTSFCEEYWHKDMVFSLDKPIPSENFLKQITLLRKKENQYQEEMAEKLAEVEKLIQKNKEIALETLTQK